MARSEGWPSVFVQDAGFYFHGGGGFQAARTPSFREYRACATAQRAGNIRSVGEAGSNRLKLGAFCPPLRRICRPGMPGASRLVLS